MLDNAYQMLQDVRSNIGEATASHWTDLEILRKLNAAYRDIGMKVVDSPGDWMVTSGLLTPVASVITMPSLCAKPVYVEEVSSGREIPIEGTVRERRLTRPESASYYTGFLDAYLLGDTIVVNKASYTSQVRLWYEQRLVDLHAGVLGSNTSATILEFQADNFPNGADDYYNDIEVEVFDVTNSAYHGKYTVSDYAGATGQCTVASGSGYAAADLYGTVSQLPRECNHVVVAKATVACMSKPNTTVDEYAWQYHKSEARDATKRLEEFLETRKSGSTHVRTTEFD